MHFTSLPWYSLILQLLVFCYTTCWKRLIIDVGGRLISFKACLAMGALVYIKVHFKMAERGEKKICPVKGTMKGDLWGQHFSKYFVLILCICPIIWDILNWFLWADGFTSRGVEAGLVGNLSAALSLCYLQKVRGGCKSLSTVTGTFCARGASALQRREWKIWFDVFPQIIGFFLLLPE